MANTESQAALRVDADEESGGAVIRLDGGDEMFAVGDDGPDQQPRVWERRWIVERETAGRPRMYLRVERHRAPGGVGVVEQEAYLTDSRDVLLDLATLPRVELSAAIGEEMAASMPDVTVTGLRLPLVTRVVCDMELGQPAWLLPEADLDILDTMTSMISRLDRAMALHGLPKLKVGRASIDDTGNVRGSDDYVIDPDGQTEYLAASVQFGDLLAAMNRFVGLTLTVMQMSPALLGVRFDGGATPDSAEKLRIESTNTLARGRTTAAHVNPALSRVLQIASELEARLPGRGWATGPVSAELRPSLPKDRADLASELSAMLLGPVPLIDHRSALAELHGEQHADSILEAIEADQARSADRAQRALGAELGLGAGTGSRAPGTGEDSGDEPSRPQGRDVDVPQGDGGAA